MINTKDFKKKRFKSNEEYFRFIENHKGEIESIDVQWQENIIICKYKLKERREVNGKNSVNNVNNFVNIHDNSSHNRNN